MLIFREAQQVANILFSQLRKLMNFDQKELDVFKKGDEEELHRLGERIKQVHKFDKLDFYKISNWDIFDDSLKASFSVLGLGFKIKHLASAKLASERKKSSWQKWLKLGADVAGNIASITQDSVDIHNRGVDGWNVAGLGVSLFDMGASIVDHLDVVSEEWETALDLIGDIWNLIKCIKDNVDRGNMAAENIKAAKQALKNVKMALDKMKISGRLLDDILDETDRKVARLTEFANKMYAGMQPDDTTRCSANNATIVSDIKEITDVIRFVTKNQKENKILVENMEYELKSLERKNQEFVDEEKQALSFQEKSPYVTQVLLNNVKEKRAKLMPSVKKALMEKE